MLSSILLVLIIVLALIITYLLFAPLLIEIDTHSNVYMFSVSPLFSIRWVTDEFPGHAELNVLGFKKKLDPFAWNEKNEVKQIEKRERRASKFKMSFQKMISLFKSFRIRKWLVNIDTGNMALNGEMYPFMYLLTRMTGKEFYINFVGKTEVVITIENNAFRMLMAFIK